jgi:hypothetical protein
MLITVLLPTRQRVQLVERSVVSLLSQARCPQDIEISVAFDQDDEESCAYFNSASWKDLINQYGAKFQVFETPHWGYANLQNYYNLMAQHAQGLWLMIWNDDAVMKFLHWDDHIRPHTGYVGMLHMVTENYREKFALFPVIPRTWLEIFGCVSLSNSNDSWIQHICLEAQAIKKIDPVIFHDRFDISGNNQDSTYLNRTNQKKIYKSEEMRQLRKEWADKLIAYKQSL